MKKKITQKEIYKLLSTLMKDYFLIYKERYFYSDEGGALGNPTFVLSPVKIKNTDFDYVGIMNSKHILNYIAGRFICWYVDGYDVSAWLNEGLFTNYKKLV